MALLLYLTENEVDEHEEHAAHEQNTNATNIGSTIQGGVPSDLRVESQGHRKGFTKDESNCATNLSLPNYNSNDQTKKFHTVINSQSQACRTNECTAVPVSDAESTSENSHKVTAEKRALSATSNQGHEETRLPDDGNKPLQSDMSSKKVRDIFLNSFSCSDPKAKTEDYSASAKSRFTRHGSHRTIRKDLADDDQLETDGGSLSPICVSEAQSRPEIDGQFEQSPGQTIHKPLSTDIQTVDREARLLLGSNINNFADTNSSDASRENNNYEVSNIAVIEEENAESISDVERESGRYYSVIVWFQILTFWNYSVITSN